MEPTSPILIKGLILALFSVLSAAQDFDFFYLVLQWPGAYCDTSQSCCYPKSGKPATDFGIHGLWPNYNDGSYPSNCDPQNPFVYSKISDLVSQLQKAWPTLACPSGNGSAFWEHEWEKHGTCAESVFNQHGYFKATLTLRSKADILQILKNAGIEPDDGIYSLESISEAIREVTGHEPGIECNTDSSGNKQLYQIYLCVDVSGSNFIECPGLPNGKCSSQIQFPSF